MSSNSVNIYNGVDWKITQAFKAFPNYRVARSLVVFLFKIGAINEEECLAALADMDGVYV